MLCIQLGELLYKQLYVVSEAFTFDTGIAHGRIIAAHEKPSRLLQVPRPRLFRIAPCGLDDGGWILGGCAISLA
jgi:hypothetical protein